MIILKIYIIFLILFYLILNQKKNFFKKKTNLNSNEDRILLKFNHKNIIRLKKVETKYNLFKVLYLEYFDAPSISKINVEDYINNRDWEENVKNIMFQLISAIKHIHEAGVIHNDIHPDNILYNEKTKKILILDFDEAIINTGKVQNLGNRYYTAPEKVIAYENKTNINNKVDIYSLGCIFHVLLTGYTIYWDTRADKIHKKDDKFNGISLNHLEKYSNECKNLLFKMLYKNHSKRISAEEAFEHNWFKNKL